MSWISRHPLTALAALALILRVAVASATEVHPVFPAYYYTDAVLIHSYAVDALEDIRAGRASIIKGTLSERLQTGLTIGIYRAFSPRPLSIKIVNAVLGALGVIALTRAFSIFFPFRAALTAGLLVAVWPSHVFYTSQNLKEAPADLLAYLALGAAFAVLAAPPAGRAGARAGSLAMLTACLLGAGFYRSYVLLSVSAGLLLAFALTARERPWRTGSLLGAAAVIAALSLYSWMSHRIVLYFEPRALSASDTQRLASRLIPVTYDEFDIGVVNRPTSPQGITAFRKSRQFADRRWAKHISKREIGTQIYPDATFDTWLDVLLYLPKGAFTVLFQPLPGLYPLDGKIGRYAAAGENLILLALSVLAGAGILRGPKTPARFGLLGFFAMMTAGAALLEFDLGSAGRHKLLYLPMLFPFATEEALRLYRGTEPS